MSIWTRELTNTSLVENFLPPLKLATDLDLVMKLEVEALPGLPEPGARLRLLAWAKPLKVALFSLRQEYSAVCSRVGGGQLVATIGAEIRCGEREKV